MSPMTHLVGPAVTSYDGLLPDEVEGVAGQVQRVRTEAAGAAAQQHQAAAEILADADPQAWLFIQRRQYLETGQCDPYAEQMLRRMHLLPAR